MSSRGRRLAGVALSAIAVLGFLSSCDLDNPELDPSPTISIPTPTGTPSHLVVPDIVWAEGIAPTSELEDHPLVRAAREADLSLEMAWNSGDYATDLLMRRVTPNLIASNARTYSRQGDDPHLSLYTVPWEPLEILEYDEDGGTFLACYLHTSGLDWSKKYTSPGGEYDRSQATLQEITMIVVDGELKYDGSGFRPRLQDCDGSTVPIGFFDPEPELPPTPVTKPVRPPLYEGWDD